MITDLPIPGPRARNGHAAEQAGHYRCLRADSHPKAAARCGRLVGRHGGRDPRGALGPSPGTARWRSAPQESPWPPGRVGRGRRRHRRRRQPLPARSPRADRSTAEVTSLFDSSVLVAGWSRRIPCTRWRSRDSSASTRGRCGALYDALAMRAAAKARASNVLTLNRRDFDRLSPIFGVPVESP